MKDYNAQSVYFTINQEAYSNKSIEKFSKDLNVKDLIVVKNANLYRVYSTRIQGRFHLRKGPVSLARKLNISPKSIDIIPICRSKMPDTFFLDCFEPGKSIEEQVIFSVGKFAVEHAIKDFIDSTMKKNDQLKIIESIKNDGSLATVEKGYITVGQLKGAKNYEAELSEIAEKNRRLELDTPNGYYIPFKCFKTNKIYKIYSHNDRIIKVDKNGMKLKKDSSVLDEDITTTTTTTTTTQIMMRDDHGEGFVQMNGYNDDPSFIKRKHYYFYSKNPGYGKTTFILQILQRLNASQITDTRNWMDVSKYAQFLVIDEYSPDQKITMGKLKTLTSGNASSFAGNRKSYGLTFKPRKDAQLIIFSNYHLFDVMGKKNLNDDSTSDVRKITRQEAKILSDRFFIYRLDEDESDRTQNEEFDRCCHTQGYECDVYALRNNWTTSLSEYQRQNYTS